MIITHDTFVCKPGNASKLAKLMKEWNEARTRKNGTVMTDMTGQYHRVIMVGQFKNLADYEAELEKGMKKLSPKEQKLMEKFKDMNDMYISGSREIFKVW